MPPKALLFTEQMEECIAAGILSICHFSMPVTADSHKHAGAGLIEMSNCSAQARQTTLTFEKQNIDYKAHCAGASHCAESHLSVRVSFSGSDD